MKKYIILLAVCLILVSGCGGTVKMTPTSPSSSAYSDAELLQRAELKERQFFYRGECDQSCMDVRDAYNEVIEEAMDIEIRSMARQNLAEFLFKIKEYQEGITVAKGLADTAPNDEFRCTGIILIAQNARGSGDLELSFDAFNSARTFCGEDRQKFIQENMCYLTEQAGDLEGAKLMCPWKYS